MHAATIEDLHLPALVVDGPAITSNIDVMASYIRAAGFAHAPHAKSHMAPEIIRRQLAAGAWGITVANVDQAAVAKGAGARHILIANQVTGTADLHAVRAMAGEGVEVVLLVDNPDLVSLIDARSPRDGLRVQALVELGCRDGRSGARTLEAAVDAAEAVARSQSVELVGVETYEGLVGHDSEPATLRRVDEHLDRLADLATSVMRRGLVARSRPIVSAGGTRYLDRVVDRLGSLAGDADVVVRSGSYVTFGLPDESAGAASSVAFDGRVLRPALALWYEVISRPEPALVILNVGRRNIGDRWHGLRPDLLVQPDGSTQVPHGLQLFQVDDQHAYARLSDGLAPIGSRVRCALPHPWSLDRWRLLPVVDPQGRLEELWSTCY